MISLRCIRGLLEQWDRKKNGALTPEAVSAYSNRRVWWLCDKGHSFCAVIAHRVNKGERLSVLHQPQGPAGI